MAAQNNNLVDNIIDTQKKVLDNVAENTKKFTGGNNLLNETIEKGNEWYKNWLETQKSFFNKTANAAETAKSKVESKVNEANNAATEFMETWLSAQASWAKQAWEMSQESAKKFGWGNATNPFVNFNAANNPFTAWTSSFNNAANPWSAWMNQFTNNNWMEQMSQWNPFYNDGFKKSSQNFTDYLSNYYSTLNNSFTEWQKSFENGTVHEAYKNLINTAEGFNKFAEIWMPMVKSIQDKTFNMEEYKKMMNPETYKEFMDKFFGFMPEGTREYMNKMGGMMTDNMKHLTDAGMNGYHQMRNMMGHYGDASKMFGNVYGAWNSWQNQMNEAIAPFTRLMTPNQYTKTMQEWSDINNRIMEYNIKNAELQYMVYAQGVKVMDKLADHVAKQIKDGVEVTSIVALYQEWLNISDKVYVSLFESTEYSKLMAEVAALQMKLRKDMEVQTEAMLKDIPVATRSEMDEVYKTIYDLKKQVRQLEKMLEMESEEEEEEVPAKKAASKTATKKK